MSEALLAHVIASLLAIGLLVLVARWIGRPRPLNPRDADLARALFAQAFPDARPGGVNLAKDRNRAIARWGEDALLVHRAGDGWVCCPIPWSWVDGADKTPRRPSSLSPIRLRRGLGSPSGQAKTGRPRRPWLDA